MIEINRILCPIDFSEYSDHALRYAMKLASWYRARLHVLHVMPPMPPSSTSELAAAGRRLVGRNLESALERWRTPDVDVTGELLESADPAARIIERADALDADLIVTGSHGRKGLHRVMLGSVVEPLLHRARRPMLILPAGLDLTRLELPVSFAHIVCAVDFAAASLDALGFALSIAEESDARLTLLNVIDMPPELKVPQRPDGDLDVDRIRAEAEADRLTLLRALIPEHARDYCSVETAVVEGGVSRQLLRTADETHADLIVIGVHGRNALDVAVFGSNAKGVVTGAHCPVLVVPAGRRHNQWRAVS